MASPKILFAEDDVDLRSAFCEVLISQGFDVIEAKDGMEAWTILSDFATKDTAAELYGVVSDITMPKLDGIELLKRLRASDRLNKVPFILISGNIGQKEALQLAVHGPDAILLKPFEVPTLIDRIHKSSEAKRAKV